MQNGIRTKGGLQTHFAGEILDVKIKATALADNGKPDIEKIRPIVYSPEARQYQQIGAWIGNAFSIGKNLDPVPMMKGFSPAC